MNKLLTAAIAVLLFPAISIAEITPNDVAEKMKAGDTQTAEIFTKQILNDHPNSAKAHYYMGQILVTEGNYRDGYKELKQAAGLDRSLGFASSPEKFREEMSRAEVNLGKSPAPAISNQEDEGFHWGILLLVIGLGGAIYWFFIRTKPDQEDVKQEAPKPSPSPSSPSAAQPSPQPVPNKPTASAAPQRTYRTYTPSYQQPPVVNNYNSGGHDGLLTGMMLGSMMSEGRGNTVIDRETVIERDTTNNTIQNNSFDSGANSAAKDDDFDSGSTSKNDNDFDSGSDSSSSFDSGSSSFDSGSSSFDSGSGGDSSW